MAVNWSSLFRRHGIPYVTDTPNTSKGHLNVKCPFCHDDPSEHLGVSLKTGAWNCWRNTHQGIPHTAQRLVQALLKCSAEEARGLTQGTAPELPPDRDVVKEFRAKLGVSTSYRPTSISMPKEFKPLNNGSPMAEPFIDYLMEERGYRRSQIDWLYKTYDLRYTTRGKFRYRVVIPVYGRRKELLTWTARTIIKDEEERYISLSKFTQVCAPKQTLLGLPLLWHCENPKGLIVVEGPMDAIWITLFGHSVGVYGTCLFGLSLQPEQMALLSDLRQRFPYMGIMLDAEASLQSFKLANSGLQMKRLKLSPEFKDPAKMTPTAVLDLCMSILSKQQQFV